MTTDWDVIVVGGGPAGCAAAMSVLRHRPASRVLIVDKADFPRDKVCGDGIAHEVSVVLAELGFDVGAVFAGAPELSRLLLRSPAGIVVDRHMRERVHVVPREIFDARLVDGVRAQGVSVVRHHVRAVVVDADGVVIDGTLRAQFVIAADGAGSVLRRALGVRSRRGDRTALAIRGYAPVPGAYADAQVITMTGKGWPAYAWSFPIGDGRANVGYGELLGRAPVTRSELLGRMVELLPELDAAPVNLRAHKLPLSSGRPPIPSGRVLFVGDAQSLVNPLTGEGIFYAVTSGALAGRSAADALSTGADAGARYRSAMRARLGRHFRHTTALARLGRSPALIDAGMRAAAADQRAFDDLVRFGLADGLLTARLISRLRPAW